MISFVRFYTIMHETAFFKQFEKNIIKENAALLCLHWLLKEGSSILQGDVEVLVSPFWN